MPQSVDDLMSIDVDAFWRLMVDYTDENDVVHLEDAYRDFETWYEEEKCDSDAESVL